MTDKLNLYGDALVETTGVHGADIASQRLDELDRRALLEILGHHAAPRVCVDLGCGLGRQGVRFAVLGAEAHLFDLIGEPDMVSWLRHEHRFPIYYTAKNLTAATAEDFPARIDLAFSQRFVHYLRFDQAVLMVRVVGSRMPAGALFFISASGIDSGLGAGYPHRDHPLPERFAPLNPGMQSRHGIREAVCLYNEVDLTMLMRHAGFLPLEVWRSPFGNIKGVFRRQH